MNPIRIGERTATVAVIGWIEVEWQARIGTVLARHPEGREFMRSENDDIDSVEALSWLKQADGKERTINVNGGACLSTEDALKLVQELYAAGATEVVARIVAVEYEFEEASGLAVELPQDREKRMALFAIEARALREMGSTLDSDGEQGQATFTLGR